MYTKKNCNVCSEKRLSLNKQEGQKCGKTSLRTFLRLTPALSIRHYLAKNNIPLVEQPPYSPNLASCDFFLLLKLKEVIKETPLGDVEAIKSGLTMKLKAIPKESFQGSTDAWKKKMVKCFTLLHYYTFILVLHKSVLHLKVKTCNL